MSTTTDMKVIDVLLTEVMNEGLELEVIHAALKAMQEDPSLSPAQAFQIGCDEWIR